MNHTITEILELIKTKPQTPHELTITLGYDYNSETLKRVGNMLYTLCRRGHLDREHEQQDNGSYRYRYYSK